jgi:hypothetical protein
MVQINLAPDKESLDSTRLELTDSLIGHINEEMLSCIGDGWKQIYGEGGLKSFVERR